MASQWFYIKGDQKHGPVSSEELKQLAASGQLLPDDLVWKDGLPDWVPAHKLSGLALSAPTVAAEPPPSTPAADDDDPTTALTRATTSFQPAHARKAPSRSRTGPVIVGLGFLLVLSVGGYFAHSYATRPPGQPNGTAIHTNRTTPVPPASPAADLVSERPRRSQQQVSIPAGPKPVAADFRNLDYSLRTQESDYAYDFSALDYAKGPNGEPLQVRRQKDIKFGGEGRESLYTWPHEDSCIVESRGYLDPTGTFVRHGRRRIYTDTERAVLKVEASAPGYSTTDGNSGEKKSEYLMLLAEDYWYRGEMHGAAQRWSKGSQVLASDPQDTPDAKEAQRYEDQKLPGRVVSKGMFVKGRMHGVWTHWAAGKYENGKHYYNKAAEEHYIAGKLHGRRVAWWSDGKVAEDAVFKNGEKHGRATWCARVGPIGCEGGITFIQTALAGERQGKGEAMYFEGERHGAARFWHPNGQLGWECTFVHDKPEGILKAWHDNGRQYFTVTYRKGLLEGEFNDYWPNGREWGKTFYKHGEQHGQHVSCFDNGQKMFEGTFVDGKKDGCHTRWTRDGHLLTVENYASGRPVGLWKGYDGMGHLTWTVNQETKESHRY